MSLISVLKSCQSTIGPGGTWRQCWPRGVWAGVLTSTLPIVVHTGVGSLWEINTHISLPFTVPSWVHASPALPWSVKRFPLEGEALFVSPCPEKWMFAGPLLTTFFLWRCLCTKHNGDCSHTALGVCGWGFSLLAPSHHPEGKSSHNLPIAWLCPFCGQWTSCVSILSLILQPFILHCLCFG